MPVPGTFANLDSWADAGARCWWVLSGTAGGGPARDRLLARARTVRVARAGVTSDGRRAEAIEAWFAAFCDSLYAFIYHRVGRDRQIAADVAQETFLTALRKIRHYDPARGEMFPWLTYIARNAIRKALRQSRRHVSVEALWDAVDERMLAGFRALRDAPLADEWLARQETADLVRMALSQIPPQYQRSLEQHYFYDRTLKQAAEIDGTSEGAAKVRLHRARLAFKAAFESIVETLADQRPPRKVPS